MVSLGEGFGVGFRWVVGGWFPVQNEDSRRGWGRWGVKSMCMPLSNYPLANYPLLVSPMYEQGAYKVSMNHSGLFVASHASKERLLI